MAGQHGGWNQPNENELSLQRDPSPAYTCRPPDTEVRMTDSSKQDLSKRLYANAVPRNTAKSSGGPGLRPKLKKSASAPGFKKRQDRNPTKQTTLLGLPKRNNFVSVPEDGREDESKESKAASPVAPPPTAPGADMTDLFAELHLPGQRDAPNAPTGKPMAVSPLATKHRHIPTFTESLDLDRATLREFLDGNFLYIEPMKDAQSVYDLAVISHDAINPDDYHTMSRAGITHFTTDAEPEFTSLDVWEREYHLFNVIQYIPFFRKYRAWKSFTTWKKGVRGRKMQVAATQLTAKLFLLTKQLRDAMAQVRHLCFTVGVLGLFDMGNDPPMPKSEEEKAADEAAELLAKQEAVEKAMQGASSDMFLLPSSGLDDEAAELHKGIFKIDEFLVAQEKKRELMGDWLLDFTDDVRMIVRGACDSVLDDFLKGNSIVADHKMTFMEKAALRTACRKLVKFVRLSDFIVQQTLLDLGVESASKLLQWLQPGASMRPTKVREPTKKKKKKKKNRKVVDYDEGGHGIYEDGTTTDDERQEEEREKQREAELDALGPHPCEVHLMLTANMAGQGDTSLVLTPGKDEVIAEILECITEAVRVLSVPESIMEHEDLAPYIQGANEEADEGEDDGGGGSGVSLDQQVMWHPQFQASTKGIKAALEINFDALEKFMAVFTPFLSVFDANEGILAVGDIAEVYKDLDLDSMEQEIEKYKGQNENFQNIPRLTDVGTIRMDTIQLRFVLLPSPIRVLEAMEDLLPVLIRSTTEALMEEAIAKEKVLSKVLESVAEFIHVKAFHETADKEYESCVERQDRVKRMTALMVHQRWRVPDDILAHNKMLDLAMDDMKTSMEVFVDQVEGETTKWVEYINTAIPDLRGDIRNLGDLLNNPIIKDAGADTASVIEYIQEQDDELSSLRKRANDFIEYQEILQVPVEEYEDLEDVAVDCAMKQKLWEGIRDFGGMTNNWKATNMEDLDSADIDRQVAIYTKTAGGAARALPDNPVGPKLRALVEEFKAVVPIIQALRNPNLQERHWEEIEKAIGHKFEEDAPALKYKLGEMLDLGVVAKVEEIETASVKAIQESVLKEMFSERILFVWKHLEFEVKSYKDRNDTFILWGIEPVMEALDDSLVTLNTILGSRFCAPIRAEVTRWQKKLVLLSDTLDEWLQCQKQWMYLETIFCAADIQRQLPGESKRFFDVDKGFRGIMTETNDVPKAATAGTVQGRRGKLMKYNVTLDKIQKSLEDYLEVKRQAFPRFYFLSNDELLEILAQARDPHAVQPHLQKCFDCIQRLQFGDKPGSVDIIAMKSPEGELVTLGKNLKARGNVEDWLMAVQDRMQKTLHEKLRDSTIDYETRGDRVNWITEGGWPGQCVATAAQIQWCKGCTKTLMDPNCLNGGMQAWHDENTKFVFDLVMMVRTKVSRLLRKILVALITTDVYAADIVDQMKKEGVGSVKNFMWEQQLRYYWDPTEDDCLIRHANAVMRYCYEYMGCTGRLVITPLTAKCWITITGAIHLKLGAAPAGPAGTGKTESSKDLAKAMGTFCVVFNCSDQIDYIMLGKLFAGLAQCGCWCCLDEFNRINIEVLSVVAQQLLVLRVGMKSGKKRIDFEGRNIQLLSHCVIVTMNPGYAGRTALPDNLKVCFRPIAMMVPNYALISEIILYAQGFETARVLARKMAKMYILCSEQLSQQPHYDYGLRAIISVLLMAGGNKRANPDLSEDIVLIKSMRDSNLPKFLSDDVPLFRAILVDLFPGVEVPTDDYGDLLVAIKAELVECGYQEQNNLIEKIIQLHDMLAIRFGVVIVGPTQGGKTVCWKMVTGSHSRLRRAEHENLQYQISRTDIINPKAINMGELYGEFNEMTMEWTDGLGSTIVRRQVREETDDKLYIMFDGPIDTLWIESLNTVLDDNRMLCLANGERIRLKNLDRGPGEMRMLFEVEDLAQASPATVSRLGVVYLTPGDLGWKPYVESWVDREFGPERMNADMREFLVGLFDSSIDAGLEFKTRFCLEPIATTPCQQTTSICNLFLSLYKRTGFHGETPFEKDNKALIHKLYAFSYAWGMGASIRADDMERFAENCEEVMDGINFGRAGVYGSYLHTPSEGGSEKSGYFRKWEEIIEPFHFEKTMPYVSLVVPTLDTTRYGFMMQAYFDIMAPCFFTGQTGTGKTVVAVDLLTQWSKSVEEGGRGVIPIPITFSGQTQAKLVQLTIEAKFEKKRKDLLGPPIGKKIAIFVDDVNMPAKETYGAQPPIELLRQTLDHSLFYDRDKLFLKNIEGQVLFCAAAPPGGGRADITQRFTRHFHMFCLPPPSDGVLSSIFSQILSRFLEENKFNADISPYSDKFVECTIRIFQQISMDLRPTPSKSHYTFNLRDVSKVFQGCLMTRAKEIPQAKDFCLLWVHELSRIFKDRLVNEVDAGYFDELVGGVVSKSFSFGLSTADLFETELPILFCDFLRPSMDDGPGIYEPVKDRAKLEKVLYNQLEDYNLSNPTQMKLVFFMDAIKHVCRATRMLRQPRGNAMLVGVGGSGKQSVTRMACHLSQTVFYQIVMIRGYNHNSFLENLKEIMLVTGVEGKPMVFCLVDTQIVNESFLEDVNNILNTGEVPNLFASDEYSKIREDLRPVMKAQGLETADELQKAFVDRVRANLHIIICHSPVGDALRVRCREFPSLINCTTIDWYTKWPKEALTSVARQFLHDEDLHTDEINSAMCDMCAELHWTVGVFGEKFFNELRRQTYTTPKSFLDMIELYKIMLAEKRAELGISQKRLSVGVQKLEETNAIVADLQVELTALQPVLVVKAEEAAAMIIVVERDQKAAETVKANVEVVVKEVEAKAAETKVIADDAQADLDEAMPAFNNALKALDSLSKDDINEIKSFAKPPEMVQVVMEAVCILLGRDTDWKSAKNLLGEMTFMESLKTYDKDNIPKKRVKAVNSKKYVKNPKMTPDAIGKVSTAAKSLCMWIHAMSVYDRVAKTVGPKKALLARMNKALDEANAQLQTKQDELQEIMDKVEALQKTLADTLREKKQLEDDTALTQGRLKRAEKLTVGLADEHVRWQATVAGLDEAILNLIGDVFISAACISYYGPFTGTYRDTMVTEWITGCKDLGIPTSDTCTLRAVLEDPVLTREWQLDGLPSDEVSTNNAIMVTRGKRWPLLIDPQEQGKKWIMKMEEKHKVCNTRLTDKNMLRDLENCIRIGRPLLIEDIGEQLDPALEPVLQRAVYKQSGRLLIKLGDTEVDYDETFRFYLTTKLPNPHYLPEVCIKVTIINFTVTLPGLIDQLLGDVVIKERPDVEERMVKLVMSIAADKKQMLEIETKILKSLSESEGNILDDVELIRTLDDSKVVSSMISQRLEESVRTKIEIDEVRETYKPVSIRASLIYFVVADLALVDPMYQFSLAYFKRLFGMCIDESDRSDVLEERLESIIVYSTEVIYVNVCRGLFEKDKLTFSFLVCSAIMRENGTMQQIEWNLLLRGAGLTENPVPNPCPEKIKALGWNLLYVLSESLPEKFGGISDEFVDGEDRLEWMEWFQGSAPHQTPLPSDFWNNRLNSMQKMLLVKALREEKGAAAIMDFVGEKMGHIFVQAPPVRLEDVYKDSSNRSAVVFILSTGADPTGLLLTLARAMKYEDRLNLISMGQGQGPKALQMVANGTKSGDWVLLQNCHLAKSWMSTLESLVDGLAAELTEEGRPNVIHDDFRLWLTSMPATYFPIPVLQSGVKMTNEPPRGLRANISRSLVMLPTWTNFEECEGVNGVDKWKRLAYATCFFHAMVQERRRFGPLGWNITYEFNDSDLEAALLLLKMFLEEQPEIPYDALQYMTAVNGYGGRVTDFLDERCIETVLTLFYNPDAAHKLDYSFDPDRVYTIPDGQLPLDAFKEYTASLPVTDGPEVFGLHSNAIITVQYNETQNIIGTSLMLQPRETGAGGGGKTPDETVTEVTISIEDKLPEVLSEYDAGPKAFIMRGEYLDSLSTALKQEMIRYNKILVKMKATLHDIQRAIKGEVLMSAELDEQYMATLNNVVPSNWAQVAYPSLKPLASWYTDLIERVAFQKTWLLNGQPDVFWLGGFYFPQGFMTGTLQNHARKYKLPIDELSFGFRMMEHQTIEEVPGPPDDGVYIYGVYFDGCRWETKGGYIDDARPQTNWEAAPVIQFIPTQNYVRDKREYMCPVYKTSTRQGQLSTTGMSTNFVLNIDMPCQEGVLAKKWVLAGAGAVVNLND